MTTIESAVLLEAALHYALLGWPVVPLHTPGDGVCDCPKHEQCESPGKHPRTLHGLEDASCDEQRIRRWWKMFPYANIGIDLARAGLVDVAPDSIEWFAEFTARGLPPTLRFASGGGEGHAHYLYARSAACEVYRNCQTGKYDVLSSGYAVMPPSLHVSGRVYTWLEPRDGNLLATAQEAEPEWTRAMLHRRATVVPPDDQEDDAPPVVLAAEGLERWHGRRYDTRPQGGVDRSHSLWSLAVALLESGASPRFIEQLLAERDVALGWEKFSHRTNALERYRIITARAVAGRGPGRVRLKREPALREKASRTAWLSAAGLQAIEDETIRWYVCGLVGAGLITELDGKAKQAGKTTLLLALVRAVLHGEEFLRQATDYTPILYLTEQSGPSFKRNLSRAGLLDREDLHILLWNRVVGESWDSIVAGARARAREVGAGMLIVDTLAQFSGVRGDDENKSGAAMQTMEPLQAATTDGLGVVVSRHDRKSGGDVGDSGRGSSAYAGLDDMVLHLQRLPGNREGKERQRLLESISRLEETPDNVLIELMPGEEGEPSTYRVVGEPSQVRNESLRIEVLTWLPARREDAPEFQDLRKEMGVREMELRRVLRELVREDLVERFGRPQRYVQKVVVDDDGDR